MKLSLGIDDNTFEHAIRLDNKFNNILSKIKSFD